MSKFSEALRALLDDTKLFTQEEWTDVLGCELEELKKWLREESVPTPTHLYSIFIVVKRSTGIDDDLLKAFRVMADLPAREVSPLGTQMLPTVWEYVQRPEFCDLSNKLVRMTPEERGKFLDTLYPAV